MGTLKEGKVAEVVILEANALDDIANTQLAVLLRMIRELGKILHGGLH